MKMAPLGLYGHASGKRHKSLEAAEAIGKMTHLDPRSITAGIVQAYAVNLVLEGCSRNDFVECTATIAAHHEKPLPSDASRPEKGSLTEKLRWIEANRDASVEQAYTTLRCSSLVTESYPFALFMFQKYWDDPLTGMLETVNSGGDCDTTGAMYGALAGARHDVDAEPPAAQAGSEISSSSAFW